MTTAAPRHPGLGDRWATFSLVEQLGNVGSEVDRTIRAHATGNAGRFDNALARAREEFCRLFFDAKAPAQSAPGLQRYFLHFAFAAKYVAAINGSRFITRPALIAFVALAAACGGEKPVPAVRAPAIAVVRMSVPTDSTLRNDPFSQSVRRGRALLRATRDSLPHNVGNGLRCVSCHLDDGTRAFAMPWAGVYARFPQYRARSGKVGRIENRINDCFRRSLNGTPLAFDGDDMRDIVAYMSWLSRASAPGGRERGSGIDSIGPLPADTAKGRTAYLLTCARCHGVNGGGLITTLAATSGTPLWGPQSYSIGAGMARIRVAAAFIHRNMPFDLPGTVDAQTAFDIAGFVEAQARPDFAGKELDWPNGDAPPDAAYATKARNKK